MSTLALSLPAQALTAATELHYVLSSDGRQVTRSGRCSAPLLPQPGRTGETVDVVEPFDAAHLIEGSIQMKHCSQLAFGDVDVGNRGAAGHQDRTECQGSDAHDIFPFIGVTASIANVRTG